MPKESSGEYAGITDYEALVQRRGGKHISRFEKIVSSMKGGFEHPSYFSPEAEARIEAETSEDQLTELFEDMFSVLESIKSTEVAGHEIAHIIDNLMSAFRICKEYGDLKDFEKFEIFGAILGHDLGRYNEKALEGVDPKDTEFLIPLLLGRKLMKESEETLPIELQDRIMYDIATGSKPITGHRTADAVHQADREQLIGSATIPRGLAFDAVDHHKSLDIKEDRSLRDSLPIPDSPRDVSMLIQYEFYMRNLYPFSSPDAQTINDEIKKQNAVILMIGSAENPEVFAQIFDPEIRDLTPDQASHWSKKPLKKEVYEKAVIEAEAFSTACDMSSYSRENLLEEMLDVMNAEEILIPEEASKELAAEISKLTEKEQKSWWVIIQYTKKKRLEKIRKDLILLGDTEGKLEACVAQKVITALKKRELNYSA